MSIPRTHRASLPPRLPNRNLLSALDYGNGDSVNYTYDDIGRLIKETFEDGDTVSYAYNNSGDLATVTDSATGITTIYYYDLIDRIEVHETQGTGKEKNRRIAIYYRFVGYLELPAGKINPHYTADLRRGVAIEYIPKQPA